MQAIDRHLLDTVSVRKIGPSVAILTLEAAPGFQFQGGQWVNVCIPATHGGGARPFSLASVPAELPRVQICARLRPGTSTTAWIESLSPGDVVELEPPKGKLVLAARDGDPLLFVGTSVGIGPLRALIVEAERVGYLRAPCRLFHAVRYEGVLPYQDEMERIAGRSAGFDFDMRIMEDAVDESSEEAWEPLRVTALQWVAGLAERIASLRVFLTGHGSFVTPMRMALRRDFGVDPERIRQEIFWS
ncbi:MAG: FAD-dependent oxidoreductase [Planctomycetota bacterium]